jgi:hypothetical protein
MYIKYILEALLHFKKFQNKNIPGIYIYSAFMYGWKSLAMLLKTLKFFYSLVSLSEKQG